MFESLRGSLRRTAQTPGGQFEYLADALVAAIAASLPLSTSATSILIVIWLIVLLPTIQWTDLRGALTTPAGGLPLLLWLLALVGMLWSDVSVPERFAGLAGYNKLLCIPLLILQFRRSNHVQWVVGAFLMAATGLLFLSWLPTVFPSLESLVWRKGVGVPVKDYVAQSAIFQLCVFALIYAAVGAWRGGRHALAIILAILSLLFFGNIIYLTTSHTALVVMPLFFLLFGYWLLGWRGVAAALVGATILTGVVWASSDNVRDRITGLIKEAQAAARTGEPTSTGLRLEFYRKSLATIATAPIIGHGTGTIHRLFAEASAGKTGAAGNATMNPHQQTLAVAIQLGIVGALVLWAMWIAHLLLFRASGIIGWCGFLVVAQNILSSPFHSHLFDFTQGWLYVFGVGALGGAVLHDATIQSKAAILQDGISI